MTEGQKIKDDAIFAAIAYMVKKALEPAKPIARETGEVVQKQMDPDLGEVDDKKGMVWGKIFRA